MYARAILGAEKRVNGRKVTHNLLHMDSEARTVPPRITHCDPEAGEAVVSVWAATGDYIWGTQEHGSERAGMAPERLADFYLTEDGTDGRLVDLMRGSGPLVLITHWQSLYSNGSRLGLQTYKEIVRRIATLWGRNVTWCKLSELTERFLAAQTAIVAADATRERLCLTVASPFATDVLTCSIPMPWPLFQAPTVRLDGGPIQAVERAEDLQAGTWWMEGSVVTVSMKVERNKEHVIVVTPNGDPGLA